MALYDQVVTLTDQLTLVEKARLLEHLSAGLKHDLEVEAFRRMPWHEFIERTAGILADDPIQRGEQGDYEIRRAFRMKYLLDTNIWAMKSQSPQTTLAKQQAFVERFVSLAFDDAAALVYGRVRAELERAGTLIGPNDLMIASIALANGLILVTHNIQEFGRVTLLQTEDWEIE